MTRVSEGKEYLIFLNTQNLFLEIRRIHDITKLLLRINLINLIFVFIREFHTGKKCLKSN